LPCALGPRIERPPRGTRRGSGLFDLFFGDLELEPLIGVVGIDRDAEVVFISMPEYTAVLQYHGRKERPGDAYAHAGSRLERYDWLGLGLGHLSHEGIAARRARPAAVLSIAAARRTRSAAVLRRPGG